jgi:hypothetical protein
MTYRKKRTLWKEVKAAAVAVVVVEETWLSDGHSSGSSYGDWERQGGGWDKSHVSGSPVLTIDEKYKSRKKEKQEAARLRDMKLSS